jgi:hypothetical protein
MRTKFASKTITRDPEWLGPAIPPGEILLEEYLKPIGLGQLEAAKRLGISLNRLTMTPVPRVAAASWIVKAFSATFEIEYAGA